MKSITITLDNGLKLAALVWGDASKPPLLALHGWLDNANSFVALADYLKDYYLIAVDLPGHGLSDHLAANATYHFIDQVAQMFAVADKLQWSRFSLLGHSMGAGIATLMAGTFPERVERLVLIEGLGPFSHAEDTAAAQCRQFIKAQKRIKASREFSTLEQAIKLRLKNSDMRYADAALIVERGTKKQNNYFLWRHDPRLLKPSPLRLTEKQVESFLSNINMPTQLILAKDSFVDKAFIFQQRQTLLKNIRVQHFIGGHHLHMEYPQKIAGFIKVDPK